MNYNNKVSNGRLLENEDNEDNEDSVVRKY